MNTINLEDNTSMDSSQLNVPILFLFFNRLSLTKRVFESIKQSKPKKIYLASDGPREEHLNELQVVESIRHFVLSNINWDCEIHTLFRDKNLGCKYACSEAVTWFFDNEELGIVLEDDTVPTQSFYKYCTNLLKHYQYDERIGMIAGNAPLNNHTAKDSYYFSRYVRFWGWASWRRAWKHYDVECLNFDNFMKTKGLSAATSSKREEKYWRKVATSGTADTWDYQWLFACWEQSMLTIIPSVNLVTNIGFNPDATHTVNIYSSHNQAKNFELSFPLVHPDFVIHNKVLDDKNIELEFLPSIKRRIINKLTKIFNIRVNKFFS